ncbi:flagellar basal-body rod protein FlgB [Hydrogenispora ethanolica]|jgi:flagellar basal-body rod protein FlgB|uniref:Flagellar basal body rod protein FlgB n=1 Tax=Hydrogenispora ethanolica TaxID=1082276 RepID=A0A4R1RKF4_HYDET|nr:flagellar basal body rod protein FlgB [Hydrogenispora ethanolica]TCL66536.1 flagellar basal-body rod protein FlgB [Hydrogenispora ethanolica]
MVLDFLNDPATRKLERSMDATVLRSQLLSHNIANANTPDYKRVDLDFASVLADTMNDGSSLPLTRTHPRHLPMAETSEAAPAFRVTREWRTSTRQDGNNVDVEFEMAQVAENTLHYQALGTSWKQQMSRLKMAIEGR